MKNNKKIMSAVAGVCIASQLLPMGTVIANAQTNSTTNIRATNQYQPFRNEIQIYNMEGKEGFKITFDNKHDKLNTEFLFNNKDTTLLKFDDKNPDKVCLNITIYDVKKVKKEKQ